MSGFYALRLWPWTSQYFLFQVVLGTTQAPALELKGVWGWLSCSEQLTVTWSCNLPECDKAPQSSQKEAALLSPCPMPVSRGDNPRPKNFCLFGHFIKALLSRHFGAFVSSFGAQMLTPTRARMQEPGRPSVLWLEFLQQA